MNTNNSNATILASSKTRRVKGDRYCVMHVELTETEGKKRLSITGEAGRIVAKTEARKLAREYWESFFADDKDQIHDMNKRCGTAFRSPKSAAKYVIDNDGEFHGLEVTGEEGDNVFIGESFGQIREELLAFFPEVEPHLPWHLNNMKPDCEHQEALGWGPGKDIALVRGELTEAQQKAEARSAEMAAVAPRAKLAKDLKAAWRQTLPVLLGRAATVEEAEVFEGKKPLNFGQKKLADFLDRKLVDHVKVLVPAKPFESVVYKDSINAPCPTCGYRYGSAWLHRELPKATVDWAMALAGHSVDFVGSVGPF